jgi:hypothetical protein
MRDVVVTPATICEEHAHAVEDAAPRPSLPSRSRIRFTRFSPRWRAKRFTKKKTAASAANYPSLSRFANRAFSHDALERTWNSRTTARKAIAKVFAVKAAAENSDFVDSARRCRSTRGWFFSLAEFRKAESELARVFLLSLSSAHPFA